MSGNSSSVVESGGRHPELFGAIVGAEISKISDAADYAKKVLSGVNLGGDTTLLYPAQAAEQQDAIVAQSLQETTAELIQQDGASPDNPVTRAQQAVREALAQQGDTPTMRL